MNPADLLKRSVWFAALVSWAALFASLLTPSEAIGTRLLGYSAERLALAGLLLAISLFLTVMARRAVQDLDWLSRQSEALARRLAPPVGFAYAVNVAVAVLLIALTLYFLPTDRAIELLGSTALYLPRLAPLNGLLCVHAMLFLVNALAHHYGLHKVDEESRSVLRPAAWIFSGFLVIWLLIKITGIGLGFDITEWNAPGAPLLASQVFIVGLVALAIVWLSTRLKTFSRHFWVVYLFILVIPFLWNSPPATPNYYSSPPVSPNYEPYPLSDAFNHDVIANNVLIGEGFRFNDLQAVRKPLYDLFLVVLHHFAENDYAKLIEYQVNVLVLFPLLLYFLGDRMHSHVAGLLVAGLVLLRERNAIELGGVINLSHAQLLMADLPAALALAGLALLAFQWLRKPERKDLALWTGGLLGLLLLLRSQNLTLIPTLALLAIPALRSKKISWRSVWFSLALFVVSITLAAGPWLLRNRALTGEWIFEQSTAASYLAQRYSADPASIQTEFLPGETEGEYYARHMAQVKGFVVEHPGEVAGFVADNYLRNLYLTVMPLPLSFELRGLEAHVRQLPYWPSWDGALLSETLLPLTLNLAVIALGISLAWRRFRWAGLVPLVINLGFSLNLALARVSGWRYNQPVDWTLILYFALGLAQLLLWAFALIGKTAWLTPSEPEPQPQKASRLPSWVAPAFAPILILALGLTPIVVERSIPPRFQPLSTTDALLYLEPLSTHHQFLEDVPILLELLDNGQLRPFIGRALYSRYLEAGQGNPDSDFALTAVQPFDRLTFYLVGPDPLSVTLPIEGKSYAPDWDDDVVVLACRAGNGRAAAVIQLFPDGRPFWLFAGDPATACDL